MTTIEIKMSDDLVKSLGGRKHIQKAVIDELEYQRFRNLSEKLHKSMKKAKGVNWETEFKMARKRALRKYMSQRKSNEK